MNLPIYTSTPDPIGDAGKTLLANFDNIGVTIQSGLMQGIMCAGGRDGIYTAQDFWTRQSTNGAAVLNCFDVLRSVLKNIYPELVTPEIDQAGDNLIVNPDGTVTVKP